jgi:hypothetical protein
LFFLCAVLDGEYLTIRAFIVSIFVFLASIGLHWSHFGACKKTCSKLAGKFAFLAREVFANLAG